MTGKELPITSFDDLASWEKWLRKHGATSSGLQLKFAKSGATKPTISKADAIEGALCHGWIDGQINKLDEHYYLTRFTPRRPGSRWSAINRKTAQRLMREGRMSEAGLREVERAKASGRWDTAYVSQSKAPPPADLKAALKANPAAKRAFDLTIERMPQRTSVALTRSMAHHPEVQHDVAEMRMSYDAAEALLEKP